jgi:hypothetical protein
MEDKQTWNVKCNSYESTAFLNWLFTSRGDQKMAICGPTVRAAVLALSSGAAAII